jgi:hypothetical protein
MSEDYQTMRGVTLSDFHIEHSGRPQNDLRSLKESEKRRLIHSLHRQGYSANQITRMAVCDSAASQEVFASRLIWTKEVISQQTDSQPEAEQVAMNNRPDCTCPSIKHTNENRS